jgi:hypothetical protein
MSRNRERRSRSTYGGQGTPPVRPDELISKEDNVKMTLSLSTLSRGFDTVARLSL